MKRLVSNLAVNHGLLPFTTVLLVLSLLLTGCDEKASQTPKPSSTPTTSQPTQPAPGALIAPPTQKAAANILAAQYISPSDQEQTLSFGDQLKVTIPAGVVSSRQALTISTVPNLPPLSFRGFNQLTAFDISLGNLRSFTKELTIEIAYDPAKIASDLPPEKALGAAYWNPEAKTWVTSRVQVDTRRNEVIIRTNHLSSWQLHYLRRGYGVNETDHFTIVYDKSIKPTVGPEGAKVSQDPANFAKQVGDYLESARSQYLSKKYLPRPDDKAWSEYERFTATGLSQREVVGRSEPPRIVVFIDQNTAEAVSKTLAGDIYLKTNYLTMDEVQHDSAHELFHSFQREASEANYVAKRWWMEATADYAADKIAWGGLNTMAKVLEDYFRFPLDRQDGIHDYSTSRFIDYLVRKGVDFKRLWDDSIASADPSAVNTLDAYLRRTTNAALRDHFNGFAEYVLFDGDSPLELASKSLRGPIGKSGRIGGGVADNKAPESLPADKSELSYRFGLNGGYTAALWGFTVANRDPKSPRALKVEVLGAIPEVGAGVYVLKDDQRPKGGVTSNPLLFKGAMNANRKSLNISVAQTDVVYILATNTGDTLASIMVKVTDNELTISPPSASVNAGQNVSFTTPGVTEKVLWSVQEGSAGGSISASGVYTAPAGAGTYHVVATVDSNRSRTATATVTVTVAAAAPSGAITWDTISLSLYSIQIRQDNIDKKGVHSIGQGRVNLTVPVESNIAGYDMHIIFKGTSFSGKYADSNPNRTHELSGSVSPDRKTLTSLVYTYRKWSDGHFTETRTLELSNVPLAPDKLGYIGAYINGAALGKYITRFEFERRIFDGSEEFETRKYLDFKVTDESSLEFGFY